MKKVCGRIIMLAVMATAFFLQGCIHEYPYMSGGSSRPPGVVPGSILANVEVVCDLSWQELLYHVDFSTKAVRYNAPHHFKIVVSLNGEEIVADEIFLKDEEFASGSFLHPLSAALEAKVYDISVWYDTIDEDGNFSFDTDKSGNVYLTNFSTQDNTSLDCAYSHDTLDLRNMSSPDGATTVTKELTMAFPGARFEIVATDVNEFISEQEEALMQDDTYRVKLEIIAGGFPAMNLVTEVPERSGEDFILTGRMRLPFDKYEELKIAGGYVFCTEEDEVVARLSVINSALVTVSQTGEFSFPVKRGYITVVRGDFLTHPIESMVTIDHIWAGEIVFEI